MQSFALHSVLQVESTNSYVTTKRLQMLQKERVTPVLWCDYVCHADIIALSHPMKRFTKNIKQLTRQFKKVKTIYNVSPCPTMTGCWQEIQLSGLLIKIIWMPVTISEGIKLTRARRGLDKSVSMQRLPR